MPGFNNGYVTAKIQVAVECGRLQLRGSGATAFMHRCINAARGFVTTEVCANQEGVKSFVF